MIIFSIAYLSRKLAVVYITIALTNAIAQRNDSVVQLLKSGDFSGANVAADSLLLATPNDCKLLTLKGIALKGLSKPNEALRSFRLALASCPSSAAALEGAAEIEFANHDSQAGAHLKQLLVLIPADPTEPAEALAAAVRTIRFRHASLVFKTDLLGRDTSLKKQQTRHSTKLSS